MDASHDHGGFVYFEFPHYFIQRVGMEPGRPVRFDDDRTISAQPGTRVFDYAVVGDGLVPDELAAEAAVPALVLAAETALETARALVEIMPRATLRSMRASAHDLPPDEIASAVTPFFRQEG